MEWNIKLSQYDSGDILEKIRATFEGYWNNPEFTPFIAAIDSERLRNACRKEEPVRMKRVMLILTLTLDRII